MTETVHTVEQVSHVVEDPTAINVVLSTVETVTAVVSSYIPVPGPGGGVDLPISLDDVTSDGTPEGDTLNVYFSAQNTNNDDQQAAILALQTDKLATSDIGVTVQAWDGVLDQWALLPTTIYEDLTTTGILAGITLQEPKIIWRVRNQSSNASLTPRPDDYDVWGCIALATNTTINAPSGTPTDGQPLLLRFKDNGTPRTLTWNAAYVALSKPLPTTTVASTWVYIDLRWNATAGVWHVLDVT